MSQADITVYGAYWCPDCRRSKKFLGEQFVQFNWVDIEHDPEAEQYVLELNDGKRIIPTIVFPDGSFLVEPSNAELAQKLGLKTEARMRYYDLAIIGGGPAGLTAAIYASREGLESLIIERSGLGGQAGTTQEIENFPGFPDGIGGQEFAERVVKQARRFDVEILQAQDVISVGLHEGYKCINTSDGNHVHAQAALVATGATYRRLGVPGEDDFIGAGIHFCATCDGPFYKGADEIVVIGGGNSASEESLQLTRFAKKVTMLVRGGALSASQVLVEKVLSNENIEIKFYTEVEAFEGQGSKLKTVRVCDKQRGISYDIHPAAAFIFIGQLPNSDFLAGLAERDPWGYVLTGHDLGYRQAQKEGRSAKRAPFAFETSIPGVFVAGDVRHGSTKQVASAVGEGAAAALMIREYLKSL